MKTIGIGATLSVSRLGASCGPLLVGWTLTSGASQISLFSLLLPLAIVVPLLVWHLLSRLARRS
jgi:hypothetical protein